MGSSEKGKRIYLKDQAYRKIFDQIVSGSIKDGKFPSEPEYCRELGISRVTLRSAFSRLEKEGLISRSHYYGTRVLGTSGFKHTVLLVFGPQLNPPHWIAMITRELGAALRKEEINVDFCGHTMLKDPAELSRKYIGIFLFGAGITGEEPFAKVLKDLSVPVVYLREEDNIAVRDAVSSVGINMKENWTAGFDYLASLGMRRIGVIMSSDHRNFMRMGYTGAAFAAHLRKRGYEEAAKMIRAIDDFSNLKEIVRKLILEDGAEALYCYSDELALKCRDIVLSCGKSVPGDVALLGFGDYHADSSLSSVDRSCSLCAAAAVPLLLELAKNRKKEKVHLTLPGGLYLSQSTKKVNCERLLKQTLHDGHKKQSTRKERNE